MNVGWFKGLLCIARFLHFDVYAFDISLLSMLQDLKNDQLINYLDDFNYKEGYYSAHTILHVLDHVGSVKEPKLTFGYMLVAT